MSDRAAVLSLHAVDPGGDDGITVDAAVVRELGCRPLLAVTSILVAAPGGRARMDLLPEAVRGQLEAALASARPRGIRVGFLGTPAHAEIVARTVLAHGLDGLVLAPTLRASIETAPEPLVRAALREHLYPVARVLLVRATELVRGREESADLEALREAAVALRRDGARAVLVTGVAARGRILDLLDDDGDVAVLDGARVSAPRVGGMGGAHAAAVAAHLARGLSLLQAAEAAQRYVLHRVAAGA